MNYSDEALAQLHEEYTELTARYARLLIESGRYAQALAAERAREFMTHGVGRRLWIIYRCVINIFRLFPPDRESWAYGASLEWPLFDGGLTSGRVRETQGNLLAAQASLRQAVQSVSSDVVEAYLNVQTADQTVTAAKAGVANAEENLRLATGRYRAGLAVYIEVIDAETALVTAETNRVNAFYGLSTARAALRRALGIEEGV